MKEAEVILGVVFPADDQTPIVVKPGKEPFDAPSFAIPAQGPAVLGPCFGAPALPVGRDHFGAIVAEHDFIKPVAIVSFVANQGLRWISDKAVVDRFRHQFYFSWRSTRCANGDRKTMAVRNCHDFRAFSALGLADAAPPFLAGTNVPSMKHSRRSRPPRSFRSCATARSTCSSTPERTQF